MSQLVLYNYFRSSTSYRVRIALNLKGLPYEYRSVHLLNNGGEQNKKEYRALNPIGGVPTLVHEGKTISQSMAIIEYLDEVFPQTPLFPRDPFLKAKVRQFCENINADIHPLGNLKVLQFLESEFQADQNKKNIWLSKWISEGLSACEKTIQPYAGMFCFGSSLTTADLFLVPQLFTARRFQVDMSAFGILLKIEENLLKNSAFVQAHPHRQPDTPEELRSS